MKKISRTASLIVFVLILSVYCAAQTAERAEIDGLQKRISDLESQLEIVIRELADLKSRTASGTTVPANNPPQSNTTATDAAIAKTPEPAASRKKELGIDIGSARLTPYGTIYFNAFGNSGPTNNIDVPLWAAQTGSSNSGITVRQTRLGLKLEGAKIGSTNLSAVVEADFYGGTPAIGIGENFGVVRVRLANVRLDRERTSMTIGQDWMVFAPQNPTSLAAAAIPQMTAAGNNWARLPQVKLQQKFGSGLVWQAAVLAPQTGDSETNAAFLLQPNSGAASLLPFFQSRISYENAKWLGTGKSGVIGVSGHYGRSRVFTGPANIENDIDSVGLALDWNFPLAKRVTLAGEAFFGRNLGGFQSGVFQSYNSDFAYRIGPSVIPGGVRAIGTRGGWVQLGVTPDVLNDRLGLYASVGIDDPKDSDLVSVSMRDWRTRNLAYAFNAIYKITPQFLVSGEFRRFHTNYFFTGQRRASHMNFGAAYSF